MGSTIAARVQINWHRTAATCQDRFGTHPVQVVHEWNTAVHVQDNEADPKKRAFTKAVTAHVIPQG
jgi:hypothetical protein